MYCLQWLIPVLFIPKPTNIVLLQNQVMLLVLYLAGLFLDRKPCIICSFIFVAAVLAICYSGTLGNCLFFGSLNCNSVACECAPPHDHVGST